MNFNEQQKQAIETNAPAVACVAGAGSGKTSTLVARIARLINDGVDPKGFVVITFTNAAAGELTRRLQAHFDGSESPPGTWRNGVGYCGTLHGFLLRLLSQDGNLVGLPAMISVFDDDQREAIAQQVMDELRSKSSLKKVLELLPRADLIRPAPGAMRTRDELVAIEYHAKLRRAGLLDFDAILAYGLDLVKAMSCRDALSGVREWPFTHLFVDEYQDSGTVDAAIYQAMPCPSKFMVFDPDQAVYSFRGGDVRNCLQMLEDPGVEVVKMEENYRCAAAIADAAQRLVEHNTFRYPKRTFSRKRGGAVHAEAFVAPGGELAFVTRELTRDHRGGGNDSPAPSDELLETAILARTHKIAQQFAEHLAGLGIPVARRERPEAPADWRLAKLALTVAANPYCDVAALRLVNELRGPAEAKRVAAEAAKLMTYALDVWMPGDFSMSRLFAHCGLSQDSMGRISAAAWDLPQGWTPNDVLAALRAGDGREQSDKPGVTICTFHAAKGREWDTVFVVGAEEGLAPMLRKDSNLEEERRLFYVAMTRARKRLVVTRCEARPAPFGAGVMRPSERSRFIAEFGGEQPVGNGSATLNKSPYSLAEGIGHTGEQL